MNIVTIDFDIIMWPSIEIYNDLVNSELSIQDILDDNPNGGFVPTADLWLYKYLTDYILSVIKSINKDHILFVESHEEVYTKFKDIYPAITLYNIDHHHDLGYGDNDECDCGSWAKYLLDKGINKDNIYIENKAKNTAENFKYSAEIINKIINEENKEIKIGVVTSDVHMKRTKYISEEFISEFYNDLYFFNALGPNVNKNNWSSTEFGKDFLFTEIKKIINYEFGKYLDFINS